MNIQQQFHIISVTRDNIRKILETLSFEQIITIPEGFNNNILWNVGHVIATSLILTYLRCNLEPPIGIELIPIFRKGTRPVNGFQPEDLPKLIELLDSTLNQIEKDYYGSRFTRFQAYETSYGFPLQTVEDALTFNSVHEAMHLGNILSMRKLV